MAVVPYSPPRRRRRPVASSIALGAATVWCGVLLVGAVTLPVYSGEQVSSSGVRSTSATLVEQNGASVLAVVSLPLVPVLAVAMALRRRRRTDRPGAGPIGPTAVAALGAFAFVTGFSIGLVVVPVVGLLAIACAAAPGGTPSGGAALASRREVPTTIDRRSWLPYLLLGALSFAVTAILPGPAVLVAFGTAAIGLVVGIVRYHDDPAGPLPAVVFVGGSLLAGSAICLLLAAHLTT